LNFKLEIIDPLFNPEWNELVLSVPDYSVFHSTEWANVIRSTYKYQLLYFLYKDSEKVGALIPLMIVNSYITGLRVVSLPFSDYCSPLLLNDKIVFEDLFNKILDYSKSHKFSSIEIKGGNNYFENVESSNSFYVHRLELKKSYDELFVGLNASTRKNIKKAVREGVSVRIENTIEAVNGFYDMNCITRRYHGLPPQPRIFFKNIFSEFISKKKGVVVSAFYNNQMVASSMFLQFGNKAIYKFGASDRNYQHVRTNNIVMWEAIKHYNNMGCEVLNLGRTEIGNEGLRRFKLGWGASEEIVNIYKYSLRKNNFIHSRSYTVGFHNHLFRIMPLIILKFIGRIMYKHIG